jgi:flagellar protein FlaJ
MKEEQLFFFLPVSIPVAIRLSAPFSALGAALAKTNSRVKLDLRQAGIDMDLNTYFSISILMTFFVFLVTFVPIAVIGSFYQPPAQVIPISLVFGFLVTSSAFLYQLVHPKLLVYQKNRLLEQDLVYAIKYLLIKIKSGIPLYDAMVGVAYGEFGEVAKEFKKTIKEISTGTDVILALEEMALRNSSLFFRRTIWQITNNMRSGADIAAIFESLVESLVKEHKIMIRRYGSELNPIILLYMMFSVIMPSLGVTVIVVMSSFSGIKVPIFMFYLIPVTVFVLQILFLSILKTKRPVMRV